MRLLCVMNGWKSAPHYWWRYMLIPIWIKKYHNGVFELSMIGFVFFVGLK